ncbi:MAG TPA: hypothetical protein VFX50_18155, partial [Gemmatimonadales bacterium]|nr:hypothetical protein [Gemmatimonadales bacterium]
GTGATLGDWTTEESWWRDNFRSRPYASPDLDFDHYRGAYRYGFENANRHHGRTWTEIESDLRNGWDRYEYRGKSTWEDVKDAARDAWDRVTGRR